MANVNDFLIFFRGNNGKRPYPAIFLILIGCISKGKYGTDFPIYYGFFS